MDTNKNHLAQIQRARRGFTLLEILIALAILGMLVGLAVVNFDKVFGQGQDQSAKIFVNESMEVSLMTYRRDTGNYPSTDEGIKALITAPEGKTELWRGPYMKSKGGNVPLDPWGEAYQYRYPGVHNTESYDLFSKGRDRTSDTPDDIGNW